ncbi:MAG: glycosyltransferase family 2 protein [Methanomicrobiales archaeon]|nr:glycosyltransferase family 2 protein [Methanomicrobiales archaeon]
MYDKDPVLARLSAHLEGRFTGGAAVPAPQRPDTGDNRWLKEHISYTLDQENPIQIPVFHCEVQGQANPLRTPVSGEYRRIANEITESTSTRPGRPGYRRTLAAIPCFNEEIAIGSVVLMARPHADEVLVIDDGCTDSTAKVARDAGATVISHGARMGKGRGIKSALGYAVEHNYDCLVFMDGDGQHNPDEIPGLIEPILSDVADFVIGFRTFDQMPAYRRFGRAVLDIATSNGSSVTDSQCGFRALSRKAMESMLPTLRRDDFSTESEMLQIAQEKDLRIEETPINCKYGDLDTSTMNPVSHGLEVLGSIFWFTIERKPLMRMSLPGLGAMFIGIFLLLQFLQEFNATGLFPIGGCMLASLFLIPGAIALVVGLILALVARMRE